MSCGTFTISSTTTVVTLQQPISITDKDGEEIKVFSFFSGSQDAVNVGKQSDEITITGIETTSSFNNMEKLDWLTESGDTITIASLDNTYLNTTYIIMSFEYNVGQGESGACFWTMNLEKKPDV